MKQYLKYSLLIFIIAFYSCKKYEIDNPELAVSADKSSVTVGEPVTFNFNGNPQILSFYSGEFLNDYNFSKGKDLTNAYLSFSSTTASGTQDNQLSILVSSDFNGNYNITDIKAANWVDITDKFTLASGNTATPSTEQDIFDLVVKGKPLYVAFRYITKPQTEYGGQRNWNISSILLTSKLTNGEVTLLNFSAGSNFGIFSYGNKQADRSVISSTALLFKGNATTTLKEEYTEDWGISRAIYISPNDLGTDKAISLKLFSEAKKDNYTYTYSTAGTYMATFVAETNNIYGSKKVVKQLEITVTE